MMSTKAITAIDVFANPTRFIVMVNILEKEQLQEVLDKLHEVNFTGFKQPELDYFNATIEYIKTVKEQLP